LLMTFAATGTVVAVGGTGLACGFCVASASTAGAVGVALTMTMLGAGSLDSEGKLITAMDRRAARAEIMAALTSHLLLGA